MKHIGLIFGAFIACIGPLRPVFADTPTAGDVSPITAAFLSHVLAVSEYTTHGQTKVEFLDGIIQIGHYDKDYILALDGGVSNSLTESGHLAGTFGVHIHAISFLNSLFNINPSLAQTLALMEVTPRYSYDADVHHGVLGFTFGARIPFQ